MGVLDGKSALGEKNIDGEKVCKCEFIFITFSTFNYINYETD